MASHWQAGRFTLQLHRPLVMGIVNVTPDSFSDGGQHADAVLALRHAQTLVEQGADILDIGGESSRPGSPRLSHAQEWARIAPVLQEAVRWNVPVSVDTYQPETMRRALDLGADIINDIHALQRPGALEVVAASKAGVCLMHMQGDPASMQQAPHYADVLGEVREFLWSRAAAAESMGIDRSRIALDPGFGFGKTLEHNLTLAKGLPALVQSGYPVLVGLSRKSMIGALTGRDVGQRLPGSLAAVLACLAAGAQIVRVHDVGPTCDAIKVWSAMRA
ncbi:7,8-dihydropteroate synthase [Thiomonas arsenitoxydans]|jgi:dihydropteroate synthase|uniref:Dihydropteroate synthase n=1 Tax=Thiomonas arsenitoxydans (strain DSM 22701 / CIP 110005 / 3As) TaxID=426114 RepID=D6CU29_THIA3|nr:MULTISPECIES: dihydropteroate synthase [Thiomonas]OYV31677.1 MAG: dihydropteroate synthase [Thiomonas sp. 20-64-9]CQR41290.1 7,8-dihydropteroate synthase [Thiomonas sp. CB3]OZB72355.1 MAG: dihydropteroate synthase [Thiomonas sp. 13-64-67]CAZ88798.1 Dihydropteroate synthase (DHPS) (Dihydropteroate pyrophosphorylase) [Thiomonas arsenitoxydans]CQR26326.1 7,8-dihydropteroate synthase [Thiomonas arsenitoxydans]